MSTESLSTDSLTTDRWRVRITDETGLVLGSGVLITANHVLTCAHVITGPGVVDRPAAPVIVDFPGSRTGVTLLASVPGDGWFPAPDSGQGDIAVLELDGTPPQDVEPAPLGRGTPCVGRIASAFGHPARLPDGVWTEGRILGSAGPRGEWLQLSGGLAMYDERIEPGFSGGGVKDGVTGRVVGVIVAAHSSRQSRLAWMVPMEVAAQYWNPLADLLGRQPVGPEQLDSAAVDALVRAFGAVRAMADEGRRQQVVHLLPAHIRAALHGRAAAARDTASIVVACLRFEDGIEELTSLVRYIEGRSDRVRTVEQVLREVGFAPGSAPVVSGPAGELSRQDHLRLLEAFLHLPGLRDADTRAQYVHMLVRYLRQERRVELDFTASGDSRLDLWLLIDRCHPIPGALRLFLEIVGQFEGDQPGFGELSLLVEALYPEPLLLEAERAELVGLLHGAPPATIAAAHRFAAPPRPLGPAAQDASARGTGEAGVEAVVREVESYTQLPDRPARIFAFVEYLAHQVDGVESALHRWVDRTAARLRLTQDDIRTVCRAAREIPRQQHRYQLILELRPDAITIDQYLLFAALQRDDEPQKQLTTGERPDEPAPLHTVIQRVDALLRRVPGQVSYELGRFTLELVLPRALVTRPVDQWELTDLISYVMGVRYPVVLRSRERLRRDDLWPQWRRKWEAVKRQPRADRAAAHLLDDPGVSPTVLRDQLWPDTKLVLSLGFPLGEAADLTVPDAFTAALAAGVPVIAWCREATLAGEFHRVMATWLGEIPVRELPRRVFEQRSAARSGDAELGRHISLVFCDADRVPQQFVGRGRLGPPVQRGYP